jgi:hypothetical protein
MPFQPPGGSQNNAAEYMASALPFVTSSTISAAQTYMIGFPNDTKFISVKNNSTGSEQLRVGFTANGVAGSNYLPLLAGESFSADYRLTAVFLYGGAGTVSFTVAAGLTGIDASRVPVLTASQSGSFYPGIG